MNFNEDKKNKIKGSLFGIAIGDCFGNIEDKKNKINNISDDTYLTIALLKALFKNPKNPLNYIGKNFLNWYKKDGKGIGNITKLSFEKYIKNKNWKNSAIYSHKLNKNKSAGNGSLMRTSPIGLFYDDLKIILYLSKAQSDLTHFDKRCGEACQLYSFLIYLLLQNKKKKEALKKIFNNHIFYYKYKFLNIQDLKGKAFVEDTLLSVLTLFYKTNTFESLLYNSIKISEDKDTVSSLACGLGGLYYGYSSINEKFINKLFIKKELNILANKLIYLKYKNKENYLDVNF